MAVHEVALHRAATGPRCDEALDALRRELGSASVQNPDDAGFFAVAVEASSFDDAVMRVRNAIAAIGGDECFELGESSGYVPHDE